MVATVQVVEIRPEMERYLRQIRKVDQRTGMASRSISKMQKTTTGLSTAVGLASRAFVGLGVSIAAIKFVQVASRFEQLQIRLNTFSDSAESAAAQWEILNKVAETTPFNLETVIAGYTTLRSAGLRPTAEELASLSDIAAGTGQQFSQLAAIVFKGAQSTELFQNVGIRANVEGDRLRVTYQGVTETIDRTSGAIQDYLVRLAQSTSLNGAASRAAAGLTGALSNTAGNFSALLDVIGRKSGATDGLAAILAEIAEEFANLRREIQKADRVAAPLATSFIDTLFGEGAGQTIRDFSNNVRRSIILFKEGIYTKEQYDLALGGSNPFTGSTTSGGTEEPSAVEAASTEASRRLKIHEDLQRALEEQTMASRASIAQIYAQSGSGERTFEDILANGAPEDIIKATQNKLSTIQNGFDQELELLRIYYGQKTQLEIENTDEYANIQQRKAKANASAAAIIVKQEQALAIQQGMFTSDILGQLSGALAQFGTDNIAAFTLGKTLAIAQVIVNTQVASALALAQLGPVAGAAAVAGIQAKGALSAAIIGATAIGQVAAGRQTGGPVVAGRPVRVGEAGAETFIPNTNGRIARNGEGGGSITNYNTTEINISGNVDQRAIDQIMDVVSSDPERMASVVQSGEEYQRGIR